MFAGTVSAAGQCSLEKVGLAIGVEQRVEDCPVELFGGQPIGVAAAGAVAVAGEAGVVAVAVTVAVGGPADEARAAAGAGDEPGKQVVGAVGGTFGVVFAAGDEDLLGSVEDAGVDQRRVRGRVVGVWKKTSPRWARLRSTVRAATKFHGRPVRVV